MVLCGKVGGGVGSGLRSMESRQPKLLAVRPAERSASIVEGGVVVCGVVLGRDLYPAIANESGDKPTVITQRRAYCNVCAVHLHLTSSIVEQAVVKL